MELEKGMYVRINSNVRKICIGISKVVKIFNDTVFVEMSKFDLPISFEKDEISDFKNNLIDLIEENDLLEVRYKIKSNEYQKELLQVIKNYAGKLYVNAFPKKIFIEDFGRYGVEILSVLTKEQFESQKYIVESE